MKKPPKVIWVCPHDRYWPWSTRKGDMPCVGRGQVKCDGCPGPVKYGLEDKLANTEM